MKHSAKKLSYRAKIVKLSPFLKLLPKVIDLLRPCFLTFVISHIFKLIITAINVRKTKCLGHLVDIFSGDKSIFEIKTLLIHLTICFILFKLLTYVNMIMNARIVKTLNKDIKAGLYQNILEKDMEFFDRKSPYDAIETINHGVEAIQNVATQRIHGTLNPFLKVIGTSVLLFTTSFELTLMVFLITPFLLYMQSHKAEVKFRKAKIEVANLTKEPEIPTYSKRHLLLIKSFSTENKELKQFVKKANQCVVTPAPSRKRFLTLKLVKGMIFRAFQILLISYGGVMIFRNKLTFGDLVTYNLYFSDFVNSISSTLGNFKGLLKSLAKSEQLFKLLEYEPKIQTKSDEAITKQSLRGSVNLRRISFSYPTRPNELILKNISLEIKQGESVAFVGHDRNGKTTLVYLILRLYDVTDGKIFIGGENIKNYDLSWLHQNMGYVPQDSILLDGTIQENLLYGSENSKLEDIDKILALANVNFLQNKNRFPQGLQTLFKEGSDQFSVSEQKRIAIARALVKNPKILIIDEPSVNVDNQEEEDELHVAINRLLELKEKTIIITSKNPSLVKNCDKIYNLEEGKIKEKEF